MNFYIIKFLAIGFTIILLFIYVILCIKLFNYIFNYDNIINYSLQKSIILLLLRLWLIGIIHYIARNYLPFIPYPFNNYYAYDHSKLKEINTGLFILPLFIITLLPEILVE